MMFNQKNNINKDVPKSDQITFHQINLQHSKLATHELVKQLERVSNFIILAQEPYFYNKLLFLPRQIKRFSHNVSKPRSCIMHHPDLNIFPLPQFSDPDTTVGSWEPGVAGPPNIILISTYWDINHDQLPPKLTQPWWLRGLIGAMFTQTSLAFGRCAVRILVPLYMIQSIYSGVLARIVGSGSLCVFMTNELFVRVCMYIDGGWL
jgi:hypothetical protein